jgi:hypothetical protein
LGAVVDGIVNPGGLSKSFSLNEEALAVASSLESFVDISCERCVVEAVENRKSRTFPSR